MSYLNQLRGSVALHSEGFLCLSSGEIRPGGLVRVARANPLGIPPRSKHAPQPKAPPCVWRERQECVGLPGALNQHTNAGPSRTNSNRSLFSFAELSCHALESKPKTQKRKQASRTPNASQGLVLWRRDHVGTFRRGPGSRYVMRP